MAQVQPQELVLTLLGAYLRPRDRTVWSGGLVRLMTDFRVKPGTTRVALTRLTARNMLSSSRSGRLANYTITARATAILNEGDSRIFSFGQATDGGEVWTVLWHAIPESRKLDRTRLTRRLRFLGFGPVHDGAWLAPRDHEHELVRLITELELRDHTSVLVGRPSAALDSFALVRRAWDLDDLAARYDAFVGEFGHLEDTSVLQSLSGQDAFTAHTTLIHQFRQFPAIDPELPPDLVPPPPLRGRAIELFHNVYAALGPPAQRYFDQVTTP